MFSSCSRNVWMIWSDFVTRSASLSPCFQALCAPTTNLGVRSSNLFGRAILSLLIKALAFRPRDGSALLQPGFRCGDTLCSRLFTPRILSPTADQGVDLLLAIVRPPRPPGLACRHEMHECFARILCNSDVAIEGVRYAG